MPRVARVTTHIALVLAATSTVAACGGSGSTPSAPSSTTTTTVPAAPTVTLTASPTSVVSGSSSALSWSSANATACAASGNWSGSQPVTGSASTGALNTNSSYTLTCTGPGGSGAATTTITVTAAAPPPPPAPTVSLTVTPTGVTSGGTSALSWSSTNATSCAASGSWSGSEPTAGSASTGALNANATYTLTCSGTGGTATATALVTLEAAVTVTPRNASLTLTQSQQFTATGGNEFTWSVDGVSGGNGTVGTITSGGLYTPPSAAGTHTILAASADDPANSASAAVAITNLSGIYTFHNDLARTGQNLQEYALTPTTVGSSSFGKRWSCPVDGDVQAQPLYVANLSIGGGVHNVLFLATQHDSIYAIDADSPSCTTYWQVSLLTAGATTVTYDADLGGCNDIPEFGITGTPVIDPATNTMYFVATTKENGNYPQRLHALSLINGAEQTGSPVIIQASVQTTAGGTVPFASLWQNQRTALALYGGGVFIGWGAHCDGSTWWGWMMRYNETTLGQTAVFNVTPNGSEGGIWMSGGGPAVDSAGSMFITTGNGTFDDSNNTLPAIGPYNDFSMSFLNLNPAGLSVHDFYTPSMESTWSSRDEDISSSGVTVLPDGAGPSGHPNLLVGSDKQSHLWLIDRTHMGSYSSTANNTVQFLTLPGSSLCPGGCVYDTPAYYNQTVYIAPSSSPLMALPLTGGLFNATAQSIAVPASTSAETYNYPGPTASVSASPTGHGIVWVLDNSVYQFSGNAGTTPAGPAILRAYDAANLATTLYSSATLAGDTAGNAVKFTVPVIANGHVYVGGGKQLTVYGLSP
jgi:hypothetical protein